MSKNYTDMKLELYSNLSEVEVAKKKNSNSFSNLNHDSFLSFVPSCPSW